MTQTSDHSFDAIIEKFAQNIYGSTKGRLRHELLIHYLRHYINYAQSAHENSPLNIIDVGAGTGIMTAEFAQFGHLVTCNDLSNDALKHAESQLSDFQNIDFLPGNLMDLDIDADADLVTCHAVLEWLAEPTSAIKKLVSMVKPGGYLSLSFFNRDAHRFGNILYGNFDYVLADMPSKNTVRLNPKNALKPDEILELLQRESIELIHTAGLRCFHDYLFDREKQAKEFDMLKQLEIDLGTQSPYKWLGKYFHIIVRRTA